ncbi:hypothetical protein SKAU_G00055440 [Synaphobranchus kaupii]|uniref:Uncharacterized protein n=1 Tax=Synaphobranchus kaupii TaxID=118154 RepID=A0A9Q1G4W3_SYNKA|nr:hypothetical protein SKAU_G00055440 [Synaphobranchus kaupii]
MGKCKFNALWLENGNFSPWLKSVQGNPDEENRTWVFEQKFAVVGETTLHVVKWYGNRSVTLLSDYIGASPVTEVKRWDRKQKVITKVITKSPALLW